MSYLVWLSFFSYNLITSITPGPMNIVAMNAAGYFGFRKSRSIFGGLVLGLLAVLLLCGLFSATLSEILPQMLKYMPSRNYAVGGNVSSPMPIGGNTSGTASSSGPIKLEISLNVGLAESDFVQVVDATVRNNDGSTEQLEAIVAGLKKAGQHQLASVINKQIKAINGQ